MSTGTSLVIKEDLSPGRTELTLIVFSIVLTYEADLSLLPCVLKSFLGNGISEWLLNLLSMAKWLMDV